MMKAIIHLLVFVAIVQSAPLHPLQELLLKEHNNHVTRKGYGQTCTALTCAELDEPCGNINMGNNYLTSQCTNVLENVCNITQTGQSNEYAQGFCRKGLTAGTRCDLDGSVECALGLECDYSASLDHSVCAHSLSNVSANPGMPCDRLTSCRFYTVTTLTLENVCNSGICQFVPDGQTCDYYELQCKDVVSACVYPTSTSTSQVCAPLVALGGSCNTTVSSYLDTHACQRDLNCVPNGISTTAGTCRAPYSQEEGGACINNDDCRDGVCAEKTHQDYLYGVCKNFISTSTINEACIDDDDCTASNGESCECNTDGESKCTNFDAPRTIYQLSLSESDCGANARASCLDSLNTAAYQSCIATACKSEVCDYFSRRRRFYGYSSSDCGYIQLCGSASAIFASLSFMSFAAVLVMLFQ